MKQGTCSVDLASLVETVTPDRAFDEIVRIAHLIASSCDVARLRSVCKDVQDLFAGRYPGYRACNTRYHDLKHTTDASLAMARVMDGVALSGRPFSDHGVLLGIVSALLHDTGYIQTVGDHHGSGGRYTKEHISRSIEFARRYYAVRGFSEADFSATKDILRCTGLDARIADIPFASEETRLLGQCLGTADLLGQMADWRYPEKLLFLFREFQEAGIEWYASEWELVCKTPAFVEANEKRFDGELGGVNRTVVAHFRERWGIDRDLYREAIEKNTAFLRTIAADHRDDYREHLRRRDIENL